MVMDVLRSCYKTKARFIQGSLSEDDILWYWSPPGAQGFPGHHAFASLNWTSGSTADNRIGEVVGRPRPYSKGRQPGSALGVNQCGLTPWFLDGAPAYLPSPEPSWSNGDPQCCEEGVSATGGLLLDGISEFGSAGFIIGKGGLELDGKAAVAPGVLLLGGGGLLVGGLGGFGSAGRILAKGGLLLDGKSAFAPAGGVIGRGGLLLDGKSAFAPAGGVIGRGGLLLDGLAGFLNAGRLPGRGGLLLDGVAEYPAPIPWTHCSAFPGGLANTYNTNNTGFTGALAGFNGLKSMTPVFGTAAPCNYFTGFFLPRVELYFSGSPLSLVFHDTSNAAYYVAPTSGFNPALPWTFTLDHQVGTGGAPGTVIVYPT